MASSLAKPGVEVIQEYTSTSPTIVTPTLIPCIVGAGFEVIDITEDDGTINSDAAHDTAYDQFPMSIAQTDFPDPRSIIDQVNVLEDEIEAYFIQGGSLYQLENGTDPVNPGGSSSQFGEAFLSSHNEATRAAIRSDDDAAGPDYDIENTVLVVALDVANPADTSQDVTISFPDNAGVPYTVDEVVAIINSALGGTYASAEDTGVNECVQIASTTYGASSSVTIRIGGGASDVLFPVAAASFNGSSAGYRVEGCGFRGQDDSDGDLETPWIEYHVGRFGSFDGTTWDYAVPGFPAGATTDTAPGLLDEDDTFTDAAHAAVTFTGAGATIPLQASTATDPGDYFYGDGTRVGTGEIIEVQNTRFRLGQLDTVNSTFDDNGNPTARVYNQVEIAVPLSSSPLAPHYAWFQARGLQMNNIAPAGVAASVEGPTTGLVAQAAEVQSEVATPVSYLVSGLTLLITITEDGVQDAEYTYTFPSAVYANIAAVAAALTADATLAAKLVFTSTTIGANDYLRIATLSTGADQAVSVSASGTANAIIGFSAVAATSATGKDVEFAGQAEITGSFIDCGNFAGGEILEVTVVDHLGTDTFQMTLAAPPADFTALLAALDAAFPSLITRVAFSVASGVGANVIDQLTITTREGGSSVSVDTNTNLGITDVLFGFDDAGPAAPAVATIDITGLGGGMAADVINFNVDSMVDPDVGIIALTEGVDWADGGPAAEQATSDSIVVAIMADPTLSTVMIADNAGGTVIPITCTMIPDGDLGNLATVGATPPDAIAAGITTFAAGANIIGDSASATQTPGADYIAALTFGFWLDHASCEYEVTFPTNSLQDAIDAINDEAGDNTVASIGSVSARALMLTSNLLGMAAHVEVNGEDGAGSAADRFGFGVTPVANTEGSGTGRPNPDFYLDITGSVNIGAQIFRNTITGVPDCPISSTLYIPYRGLRQDLSPLATTPSLLTVDDTTELTSLLSPISERNPLALGMYFALVNAPGVIVTGIGVDAVSGTEEFGTPLAFTTAAEFLEAEEVYAIAELTHSETVHQIFDTHVTYMSQSSQKGERIHFFCPEVPTEAMADVAQSGTGEVYAGSNTFLVADNPSSALTALGINPALPLDIDDGVYLEIELNGVNYKYLVTAVAGVTLTLSTTFAVTENLDGFYTTTVLVGPVPNTDYSLKVRGDALVVSATGLPDYGEIAETVQDVGLAYANRRSFYVFPDSCTAELGGPTLELEGFYMGAAVAGMVGQQAPQQPFTNLPITGFTSVQGSNDTFKESQLDVMAAGGVYIIVQEVDGAPLICRHQLSTLVTSIEVRELSITKAVDYVAKFMRTGLKNFIGKYNITPAFLDTLTSVVQGQLDFLVENGVIASGALNNIVQDEDEPDVILVDVGLQVQYPSNYIRLTLVV